MSYFLDKYPTEYPRCGRLNYYGGRKTIASSELKEKISEDLIYLGDIYVIASKLPENLALK